MADQAAPAAPNWIYVKDVPAAATADDLRKSFSTFGQIAQVDFVAGRPHQFVEFTSADSAAKATVTAVSVAGQAVQAEPRRRAPRPPRAAGTASPAGAAVAGTGAPRKRAPRRRRPTVPGAGVVVLNLPDTASRQSVREVMSQFGAVTSVVLRRRRRFLAIVQFAEASQAAAAIAASDKIQVDGATVQIEAQRVREGDDASPTQPQQRQPRAPAAAAGSAEGGEEAPRRRRRPRREGDAAPAAAAGEPRAPREPRQPREPRPPRQPREPREPVQQDARDPLFWVFVAKVPREARREDVQQELSKFGEIKLVTYQRGFYYVGFTAESAQKAAIAGQSSVQGEPVVVEQRTNFLPLRRRQRRRDSPAGDAAAPAQ